MLRGAWLAVALLYWWPLVGPGPERNRLPYLGAIGYLVLPFLLPIFSRDGLISRKLARAMGSAMWMYDLTGGIRIGRVHKRITVDEACMFAVALDVPLEQQLARMVVLLEYGIARQEDVVEAAGTHEAHLEERPDGRAEDAHGARDMPAGVIVPGINGVADAAANLDAERDGRDLELLDVESRPGQGATFTVRIPGAAR